MDADVEEGWAKRNSPFQRERCPLESQQNPQHGARAKVVVVGKRHKPRQLKLTIDLLLFQSIRLSRRKRRSPERLRVIHRSVKVLAEHRYLADVTRQNIEGSLPNIKCGCATTRRSGSAVIYRALSRGTGRWFSPAYSLSPWGCLQRLEFTLRFC